jgi:phenylalanyl-tRNA synthetase alpha chain
MMMRMQKTSGHLHPISQLIGEAQRIFAGMGFTVADGPLLEDEWHNFDALNVPANHPARDMQDTFFIQDEPGMVLRTHTSSVQMRYMESQIKAGVQPPYRIIAAGKVFRNEATDMTHEAEFFQLEGLHRGSNKSTPSFSHIQAAQTPSRYRTESTSTLVPFPKRR